MYMHDYPNKAIVRRRVVNYLRNEHQLPCSNKLMKGKTKGFYHARRNSVLQAKVETDHMIPIPKIYYDMCVFILAHVEVEGIFRKGGSKHRQDYLKKKIAKKEAWRDENVDVIDVAALLKFYMRELPVPLIPPIYHELFLACCNLDNKEELLLLATLLLPIENLDLLNYLMRFFHQVASFSNYNKMNSYNLAVCIAPNIIPIRVISADISVKTNEITRILIERADGIGIVPLDLQSQPLIDEKDIIWLRVLWNKIKQKLSC